MQYSYGINLKAVFSKILINGIQVHPQLSKLGILCFKLGLLCLKLNACFILGHCHGPKLSF